MADLHSLVQRYSQNSDVGKLKCQFPSPAGIDETGGRVNQQTVASERALPFDPGDYIVWNGHRLERATERELTRMQEEWPPLFDRDFLDHIVRRLHDVNVSSPVVAEDEYLAVQSDVHARRLHSVRAERVDDNSTVRHLLSDGPIAQDHV